jgi:putative oxygen-independent coproporphyrinogen III oxidase
VPSALPDGDPAPADGSLPPDLLAAASAAARPFGLYLHVPFCTTRCGYCDFNTYTADELGQGAARATYADTVFAELRLARQVLSAAGAAVRPVSTVFVGGGTPTLLPSADLARMLAGVEELFGLAAGAEVTTEANPDSVTPESLAELRAAGFNRVSFGMQSAVPHVLATLDRTHTPGRVAQAVGWARVAGFEQVSLDLIYGTPGESAADWLHSLEAAVALGPDHVSAYALIVEDGTRLATRIRRGELPMPDDDVLADAYLVADELLASAGFDWYEVSNWATKPAAQCRHNLAYWRSDDWWGAGPGAHSHVGGVRWWNVKHPAAYAGRLAESRSPAHSRELLTDEDRRVEDVLLRVRLAEGCPLDVLRPTGRAAAALLADDGLLEPAALAAGRAVLTLRGRLLADAVVRDLVD